MDAVEEIKQRLSIEDVLGEYMELKRAGRNFKALSPFGNEKTPSLMVSPEKQIWHDFSSGKGGNMFGFVMEMEGLDFRGALELLARKAGVDLSQYQRSSGGNTKLKTRLQDAHDLAAKFYQVQFSKNQTALEYIFKKRKLNKQTALAFRLGYAPNNGSALTDFLKTKGFTVDELKQAGLTTQRGSRQSDMFRGRIMIPLMDQSGTVIGFTGRLLEDVPNAPKYLNTPATLLYDKGRHVFGLHLAKEAIRKTKYAVVVEGNMDVIASYQAGVTNVVATAGTAVTEMHLKALGRFVHDVRLSFDGDSAGIAATERALPLAARAGVSLSMITVPSLPGVKDPDELIQKDPQLWAKTVETPQYAVDWLIDTYKARLNLDTAPGKREFSDVVLTVVRRLEDPVEQEHFLDKIGKILGVSREALASKLQAAPAAKPTKKTKEHIAPTAVSHSLRDKQNHLLAITYSQISMRQFLEPVTPDMLFDDDARTLLAYLKKYPEPEAFRKHIRSLHVVADYVKMLELVFDEKYQGFETDQLSEIITTTLRATLIKEYIQKQETLLSRAYNQSDTTDTDKQKIRTAMDRLKILRKSYTN